jgi:hypothetical protein
MTDHDHPTINRASDEKAIVEGIKNSISAHAADDGYTAEALRALAALEAHGNGHMDLILQFGEAVDKAKGSLKHGEFTKWCREDLKRCPSWVSAHRRLFEGREDLRPALAWAAATGHRWASCYSVERLLKIIADWKNATRGDSASAPKPRPKASEIIADLRQQLADAKADFESLRDPLTREAEARATELAARAAANDAAAKEELEELARRFHWRYRDLAHRETCSAPQLSKPTAEVWRDARPNTPKAEQPTSDETSAGGDQGNSIESSHTSAASAATPASVGAAPLREEPEKASGADGSKLARTAPAMLLHSPGQTGSHRKNEPPLEAGHIFAAQPRRRG